MAIDEPPKNINVTRTNMTTELIDKRLYNYLNTDWNYHIFEEHYTSELPSANKIDFWENTDCLDDNLIRLPKNIGKITVK